MIVLAVRFQCVTCALTVEIPRPLPPCVLPAKIDGVMVPNPPDGWVRGPDGMVHCAQHVPRRVEPVAVMPSGLKLVN